jgi:hexosaminidase
MGFKPKEFDKVLDFFEKRLEVIYRKYGKKMIVWQEILLNQNVFPVPKDAIIHTWMHPYDLVKVVKAGYKTILSAGWYLDYTIPTGGIRRHLWVYNWMDYYLNEPYTNQTYTQQEKDLILGGEVCAWGEVVDNLVYEERLWPRSSAIAERLWSKQVINSTKLAESRLDYFRCNTLVRRGVRATPIKPEYCRFNYGF